jgi:hypothetical protein
MRDVQNTKYDISRYAAWLLTENLSRRLCKNQKKSEKSIGKVWRGHTPQVVFRHRRKAWQNSKRRRDEDVLGVNGNETTRTYQPNVPTNHTYLPTTRT